MADLTFQEYIDFIEPQPERSCAPLLGLNICAENGQGEVVTLPKRAGAVCQPSKDWAALKTALEQACRSLGSRCTYETRQILARMQNFQRVASSIQRLP